MILVDDRVGSKSFLNPIRFLGAQACIEQLTAADFAFSGNGPDGPAVIGVERKTINEMTERSDRFSGRQCRLLSSHYDIQYLIIEGHFRPNLETHMLEKRTEDWGKWHSGFGKPMYFGELASFIIGLNANGISVLYSGSESETASWVVWVYKYFQKKWEDHDSLRSIYAPPPAPKGKIAWIEPSLVTKMAAQIPGVSQKAWAIGEKFKTPQQMIMATEKEWVIAGRPKNGKKVTVVGKVLAKRIKEQLNGTTGTAVNG